MANRYRIVQRMVFAGFMLVVLTGWNLEEGLQEVGEGIRAGVRNAEQALKEAPAAISEAGNKIEADIRKKDKDNGLEDDENTNREKQD